LNNYCLFVLLLFISGYPVSVAYAQASSPAFLHLCEGLYIYDGPAPDATITKVLYFENLVDLEDTAYDANGDMWLAVTRNAADPALVYAGWVPAADLSDCPQPGNIYQMLTKDAPHLLQPGDIVLSYFEQSAWGCALDFRCAGMRAVYAGAWHHTGVIAEQDGELVIVEARPSDGVVVNPLDETSHYRAARAIVLRVDAPAGVRAAAADYALAQVGKPFSDNYLSRRSDAAFYCSKLIWAAYDTVGGIDLDANHRLRETLDAVEIATSNTGRLLGYHLVDRLVTPDDLFWAAATDSIVTITDYSSFQE
jgi:uncharacterized protein YycO